MWRVLALAWLLLALPAAAAPARVMSLNQCTDQLVLLLLPPERIASVTWLSGRPGGLPDAAGLRAKLAQVGVNHGLAEEVVRQKPDLVVAGSTTTPATRALLHRLHYPLLEVDSADSFADIRRITRQVAQAVGEPARGEALIAQMDAELRALATSRRAAVPVAALDGAFTMRPESLAAEVLQLAGARNVLVPDAGPVRGKPDLELLLAARPRFLVKGTGSGAPALTTGPELHPLLQRQLGPPLTIPQNLTACGTPLSVDAARILRRKLDAARAARAARPA